MGEADYTLDKDAKSFWRFVINRPQKLNALNWNVRDALVETIDAAEQDEDCKALIVTGAGRAFCSGGDVDIQQQERLTENWPVDNLRRLQRVGDVARKIMTSPLIIITSVNGVAYGGGAILALAGDIIIASREAKFGFGYVKRGLVPDWGGFFVLPRYVGMVKAKNILLRGLTLTAAEAYEEGLISEITDHEQLESRTTEIALEIAAGPRVALGIIKEGLLRSSEISFEMAVQYEKMAHALLAKTEDRQEGLDAFFEKREPKFR